MLASREATMMWLAALSLVTATSASSPPAHDDVSITLLKVPSAVAVGSEAHLRCEFDSSVKMYSIKWYRDDKEFFYFIPSLRPAVRVLSLPGVRVDVARSNGRKLTLLDVSLETEGRFKCEVSTEWPHYYTADKSHLMTVVVFPDEKPTIYGAMNQYSLGDRVQLKCTSAPSKPAAEMGWLINGREVPSNLLVPQPSSTKGTLQESSLSLSFVVSQSHFIRGRLALRCTSAVSRFSLHEELVFNVPFIDSEERAALADPAAAANGAQGILKNTAGLESVLFWCWLACWHEWRERRVALT